MNARFNSATVATWQRDGAILLPSFFSTAEIAPVAKDFDLLYSHRRPMIRAPINRDRGADAARQDTKVMQEQAELAMSLPFDSSPALNVIGLHPSLIGFARAALESQDVRLYEYIAWPKFTGQTDFDQPFHMDYQNHTFTAPGDRPAERTVNFSIYASEVTDAHGAMHYVPRPQGDEICGVLRPYQPGPAKQAALLKVARSSAGPIGSVFAYSTDVYHRGTNLTVRGGRRYTIFVSYKAAHNDAIDFTAWPTVFHSQGRRARDANRKDPAEHILEHATPEQLSCLNVSAPGHSFWTEATLARVAARWPTWNLEPWRQRSRTRADV